MTRQPPAAPAEHEHGDMWRWLDLIVVVALVLILVIGAEWIAGTLVRERIAAGAQRYLAKVRTTEATE